MSCGICSSRRHPEEPGCLTPRQQLNLGTTIHIVSTLAISGLMFSEIIGEAPRHPDLSVVVGSGLFGTALGQVIYRCLIQPNIPEHQQEKPS